MNLLKKLYNRFFNKKKPALNKGRIVYDNDYNNTQSSNNFNNTIKIGYELTSVQKNNCKDEIIKILSLPESELENYVFNKCKNLNLNSSKTEITLNENEKNAKKGWINLESNYLPSGNRSKGFKITNSFLFDWCKFLKDNLKKINENKFSDKLLFTIIISYLYIYFGEYDETKRKEIYGYGQLNSIGKNLPIDKLKNQNVARCIEKSACFNAIANFLGLNSSLILSDASITSSGETKSCGHAYCVVKTSDGMFLCDPNFYGKSATGKGVPFVFKLNGKNAKFNSSDLGDNNPQIIIYDFPFDKFPELDEQSK